MPFTPPTEAAFLYAGAGALVISLVVAAYTLYLALRLSRMTLGSGDSLERAIRSIASRTDSLEAFRAELEKYLSRSEVRLRRAIQGVATVRFNPFGGEGLGGNQSFATALLDEHGSGVVISTLYSRDRVSVFGKPIEKGVSSFELTAEEKQALKEARAKAS